MSRASEIIDTGDHVHHAPTGETWVVAFVENESLYWVGWPPGRADLADCTLVRKASPQERKNTLIGMVCMDGDVRCEYARRKVLEEKL